MKINVNTMNSSKNSVSNVSRETSETLKLVCDDFGRLSFLLETFVKLYQTGDHSDCRDLMLGGCVRDSIKLHKTLVALAAEMDVEIPFVEL